MTDPIRIPLLASEGQVYVTLAATRTYQRARHIGEEEARRELTERLLDAHRTSAGPPELWRARSRPGNYDISTRVAHEGRLLIVVSVSVRDY